MAKMISGRGRLVFFLCVVSVLVYSNTLRNDYALDDIHIIKENALIKRGIAAIPEIFTSSYHAGAVNDFYRPLSIASFAIEKSIWGFKPAYDHLINVLLFAICVALLFRFFDKLFEHKKTTVAFLASLLFALHPIHTEVVANIKSRDELFCFLFAFLSMNLFLDYYELNKKRYLVLGVLTFFLSLISKETSVTIVGVVALVFLFYRRVNRRGVFITAAAVMSVVIFLFIRFSVLKAHHADHYAEINFQDNFLSGPQIGLGSRLATAFYILGYYVRLLLVPYPLVCDYSYHAIPLFHFSDPLVLIAAGVYAFLIITGLYRLFKNGRDPYAFAILFFLITISLFSNTFFLISGAMAERFVFFSSAGFCLLLSLLIEKWFINDGERPLTINNKTAFLVLAPVFIIFAILTMKRNSDWYDSITLLSADVMKSPESSLLLSNLGAELAITVAHKENEPEQRKQIFYKAIGYLDRAVAVYPDNMNAHAQLGRAYFYLGEFDSAEVHDKYALRLAPDNVLALNSYAGLFYAKGNYQGAISLCKKIIAIDPDNAEACCNMGLCYFNMEKFDSSILAWRDAIVMDPSYNSSYENMASAYYFKGYMDSARKYELIARERNPSFKF